MSDGTSHGPPGRGVAAPNGVEAERQTLIAMLAEALAQRDVILFAAIPLVDLVEADVTDRIPCGSPLFDELRRAVEFVAPRKTSGGG